MIEQTKNKSERDLQIANEIQRISQEMMKAASGVFMARLWREYRV